MHPCFSDGKPAPGGLGHWPEVPQLGSSRSRTSQPIIMIVLFIISYFYYYSCHGNTSTQWMTVFIQRLLYTWLPSNHFAGIELTYLPSSLEGRCCDFHLADGETEAQSSKMTCTVTGHHHLLSEVLDKPSLFLILFFFKSI